MLYFELYQGSGKWSYSLGYGKRIRPSEYANMSDQIVFVTCIPEGIFSKDLDSIFGAFGKILFCHIQIDN